MDKICSPQYVVVMRILFPTTNKTIYIPQWRSMRGMFPISEYYQPNPSLLHLSALANMTHGSPRADIALRHFTSLALTHSSLRISSECLPNSRIPQHRAGRSSLALRPRLALVAPTVNLIRHYLEIFRFRSHQLHQYQTLGTILAHSWPLESQ